MPLASLPASKYAMGNSPLSSKSEISKYVIANRCKRLFRRGGLFQAMITLEQPALPWIDLDLCEAQFAMSMSIVQGPKGIL